MSVVPEPLRERNRRRTREALVATGLELFARRGYQGTSIESIADAAGVSRRTFFRYFADKEELVFADDGRHVETLLAALDATAPGTVPLEAVRLAGRALGEVLATRRAELPAWEALVEGEPALRARRLSKHRAWERAIAERLSARPGACAAEARLVAGVGFACVLAGYERWVEADAGELGACIDAAFATLRRVAAG